MEELEEEELLELDWKIKGLYEINDNFNDEINDDFKSNANGCHTQPRF